MNGKQYAKIVGITSALAATLAIGYMMGAGGTAVVVDNPKTGAYAPITEAELVAFTIACRQNDYNEIARLGTRLFTKERRIPDHAVRFAEYRIESPDPAYANYLFHSGGRNGTATRVTLTVETATGRVDEFLAEKLTESTIPK